MGRILADDGFIKDVRLKLGLSQEALAHRIGVSLSAVQRWEGKTRRPSRLALMALQTDATEISGMNRERPMAVTGRAPVRQRVAHDQLESRVYKSLGDNKTEAFEGNVKGIRIKMGLSQEELAYQVGVSLSTVRRWEENTGRPSRLALKALATIVIEPMNVEGGRSSEVTQRTRARQERARRQSLAGLGMSHEDTRMVAIEGRIREIRLRLGWSLQRLAHEVGVSESTLHRWECRQTQPSGLALQRLGRVLERGPSSETGHRGDQLGP